MRDVETDLKALNFQSPTKNEKKSKPKSTVDDFDTSVLIQFLINFLLTEEKVQKNLRKKLLY